MKNQSLFSQEDLPRPPRQKPRRLMHVSDVAGNGCDDLEGLEVKVTFYCPQCKFESDWLICDNATEAKCGMPCPQCNDLSLLTEQEKELLEVN